MAAADGYLLTQSPMLTFAAKATSHFAAWIVWQTMRVSVLDDLESPKRSK